MKMFQLITIFRKSQAPREIGSIAEGWQGPSQNCRRVEFRENRQRQEQGRAHRILCSVVRWVKFLNLKLCARKIRTNLVNLWKETSLLSFFELCWVKFIPGHCKAFEPKYKDLANELKKTEPNLVLAKMDATANDVPSSYNVEGFPTIYFAPADKKDAPVKYSGNRYFFFSRRCLNHFFLVVFILSIYLKSRILK